MLFECLHLSSLPTLHVWWYLSSVTQHKPLPQLVHMRSLSKQLSDEFRVVKEPGTLQIILDIY